MKIYKGLRVGLLTIISDIEKIKYKCGQPLHRVKVRCDCGEEKYIDARYLNNKQKHFCGKYRNTKHRDLYINLYKHGKTNSNNPNRLYRIWQNMKQRCSSRKDNQSIKYYQNKGIKVCDSWVNNFLSFEKWALENGYKENLSIDRRDGDKNYCPENCMWSTDIEQMNNTSHNHFIEFEGHNKTLAEWSKDPRCKVKYKSFIYRINDLGWDIEKAFSSPRKNIRWHTENK